MSWYSNSLERKYFTENDIESKTKYQKIMVLIFTILIVIYLYFLKESINDIKNLKPWDTSKKKNLVYLSFLGSLLIAISGFIALLQFTILDNLLLEISNNFAVFSNVILLDKIISLNKISPGCVL